MGDPVFPYEEFRRGQKELALEVARAVEEGEILVVRAPTGFGKTASIIYGLLLAGADRVLYAVRTVNEIDPVLRELRRFGVPHSFLFSARRACPLMGGRGRLPPPEDFWENCRLARLRGACEYYRRVEEVSEGEILDYVSTHPSRHAVSIAWGLAGDLGVCPFFSLLKASGEAKFTVVTYPYVFRPDIFESVFDPLGYEDFILVVDEAHTLVQAHSLLEQRIRVGDIERALEEVREYAGDAQLALEVLEALLEALRGQTPRRLERPVRLDKAQVQEALSDLDVIVDVAEQVRSRKFEEALASTGPEGVGSVRTWVSKIAVWAGIAVLDYTFIFAEPGDGDPVYVAAPMDPSVVVRGPLEQARAAILASGTLPEGDFIRELFGVERKTRIVDTELLYGKFTAPSQILTVAARDVTSRYRERGRGMYRRIASYVALIARGLPGLKLFVYPSYEFMRSVIQLLPVDIPMVVEERGTSLDEVEAEARSRGDLSIHAVAGGKLVEGVEFSDEQGGNLLHVVAMVGVPYPQPDDYTLTQLEVLSGRLDRQRARYYVYEFTTVVRIKQALGRATRDPGDRAVYFLLDRRYITNRQLRQMLRLPIRRITTLEGLGVVLEEARRHLGYSSSSRNDSIAS